MSQFLFPDALRARRWEPAPSAFLMKFMAVWMYNSYILKFQRKRESKGKEGAPFYPIIAGLLIYMLNDVLYNEIFKICQVRSRSGTFCHRTVFPFPSLLGIFYWFGRINGYESSTYQKKTETGRIKRKMATSITPHAYTPPRASGYLPVRPHILF